MRNTLRGWSALLCIVATPALADVCEDLSPSIALIGVSTDPNDRSVSTFGIVAESCPGLPAGLRRSFKAASHSSPVDQPRMLARASAADEALPSFQAACPGWDTFDFARDFALTTSANKVVFRACRFDRFKVVTEKEFCSAELRVATAALVMYSELSARGLAPKVARQLARIAIVPSEAPAPPPQPKEKKRYRDLSGN